MTMTAKPSAGQSAALRLVRQIEAIDVWNRVRREREHALRTSSSSREARMDVDRRVDVLHRAHGALLEHTASVLAADPSPMVLPALGSAVIAHGHEWFVRKVSEALSAQGVTVVVAGGNGADALGVVVAEQPDLLLVGETLAMLTGEELVAEAAALAPQTAVVAQVQQGDRVGRMLEAGARTAFARQVPPADVAASLVALLHEE
jgi:CheY-like chemotaxis protein